MSETNENNETNVPNEPIYNPNPASTAPVSNAPVNGLAPDSKSNALLMWILSIFFGFIPALVFYIAKKDDAFVLACSKEALNMALSLLIFGGGGSVIAIIIMFVPVIGLIIGGIIFVAIFALYVAYFVFFILGAVAANNSTVYRAPFALRLIK